jgi:hypothetical protein
MSEPILNENESELLRVLSNPENFLMSEDLQGRLSLDVHEALDTNLESSFVVLLGEGDTRLACPLLAYSKTTTHYDVTFLISEEQVPHLFNLKNDLKVKMVTKNTVALKEFIMTPNNEIEMFFGQDGYIKVKVRL